MGPLPATLPANITTVTLYDNSNLTAPVGGFGGWANKPIFDFLNVGDNPSLGGRLSDYPLMSWPALRVRCTCISARARTPGGRHGKCTRLQHVA